MRADLGNTSGGASHGWLEIGLKRPFATIQVFGGWTSLDESYERSEEC